MINLLYHSHTIVPGHLAEIESLGLLEADEQVLVALDGVLLDEQGQRLSGPTLHDYVLLTSLRVLLLARDYGRHLCCAFPLPELTEVAGQGLDPLHAQLQLTFAAPGEEVQRFTLSLMPLAHLHGAQALLQQAAAGARALAAAGYDAHAAAPEIVAMLSEQIYGHVDGPRPGQGPYRWPGAGAPSNYVAPNPDFTHDPASLPPGQVYAAGRLARSAWDTLRRSLREADLPFDLSTGSLRELADTVRAVNDLVRTVTGSPAAQQMAMAFLSRQAGQPPAAPAEHSTAAAPEPPPAVAPAYHEIPLRRRQEPAAPPPPAAPREVPMRRPREAPPAAATPPDRRELPLYRRGGSFAAISGSGDADKS